MGDSYTNIQLVECNRLHSDEANSNNNENLALWTNSLGNTIHLDTGDKVSVYSSFVSERGAGQGASSIQVKGTGLGKEKTITYSIRKDTSIPAPWRDDPTDFNRDMLSKYYVDEWEEFTETEEMRDDKANIVISYYKNANGHLHNQLPRRWEGSKSGGAGAWKPANAKTLATQWDEPDDTNRGRVLREIAEDNFMTTDYKFVPYSPASFNIQEPNRGIMKPRLDNSKFTMFVRDKTYYNASGTSVIDLPPYVATTRPKYGRDPENARYYRYREKKTIQLPTGFNSAQFISDEVTRQLNTVTSEDEWIDKGKNGLLMGTPSYDTTPITITKSVSSNTYKPFNSGNYYINSNTNFTDSMEEPLSSDPVLNNFSWYQGYQHIAIKRPEIYEKGSLINITTSSNVNSSTGKIELGNKDRSQIIYGTSVLNEVGPFNFADPINRRAEIDLDISQTGHIDLDMIYTQENLLRLKEFLDAQASYPEIWSKENIFSLTASDLLSVDNISINNSRFFHINEWQNNLQTENNENLTDPDTTALGCSYYIDPASGTGGSNTTRHRQGQFIWIYMDQASKDDYIGPLDANGSTDWDNDSLYPSEGNYCYGCFGFHKYQRTSSDGTVTTYHGVRIYPNKFTTTSFDLSPSIPVVFSNYKAVFSTNTNASYYKIEAQRKIGYDTHFNAVTTVAMNLNAGYPSEPANAMNLSLHVARPTDNASTGAWGNGAVYCNDLMTQVYVGANDPKLNFDGTHFSFQQLHTAENAGNPMQAGTDTGWAGLPFTSFDAKNAVNIEANTLAFQTVYKMNPIEDFVDWTPSRLPYRQTYVHQGAYGTESGQASSLGPPGNPNPFVAAGAHQTGIPVNQINVNLDVFAIYDSKCGIFIEDLGYDETTWDDGLWGTLGFTYEQTHNASNTRGQRITASNVNKLSVLTTNAEVKTTNTKTWIQNGVGVSLYADQLPLAYTMKSYAAIANVDPVLPGFGGDVSAYYNPPSITEQVTSMSIIAQKLPVEMTRGFYTIRSDIIPNSDYVGGQVNNTNMPVIAVIDKMNGQGDFYFGTESDIQFTILKPTTLSSISVGIFDPDGTLASCDRKSAVIFKVEKQVSAVFDQVSLLMSQNKSKGKL